MSFDWAINGIQIVKIERLCAGATGQEASCTSGEAAGRVQNPWSGGAIRHHFKQGLILNKASF